MKICFSCKDEKEDKFFAKNNTGGRKKLCSYCKECVNKKSREVYDPIKAKTRYFDKTYGLTLDQYNQMVVEQDGRCKLCERIPYDKYKKLNVDHDHDTNEIRGLLCRHCNTAIGLLHDDAFLALKIYHYLKGKPPKVTHIDLPKVILKKAS